MLITDGDGTEPIITSVSGGYLIQAYGYKIWVRDLENLKFIDGHIYDGIKEYSKGHWHITLRSIYHFIKRG